MHSLIVFSPLPPLRNGIADYTQRLLAFHRTVYKCIVVVDDAADEPIGLPDDVLVMRDVEYRRHATILRGERHLFHVGNNSDHIYMLDHLASVRGSVVVHDPSLYHMFNEAISGGPSLSERLRRYAWQGQGYAGYTLVDQALRLNWHSLYNHLFLDGLGVVLEAAAGAIVHSWIGLQSVEQARPDLPCRRIAHFADLPKDGREARRAAARTQLGLPQNELILLSLGFITNAKQIRQILDAIALIRAAIPQFRYLLVGEERELSVHSEASNRGLDQHVQQIGYVAEEELTTYLDAADILLNLRYPTMGETSGSLSRALAQGVCAFVSDHGSFAEIPDGVIVKIPALVDPGEYLATPLLAYATITEARRRIETAAAAWAEENSKIEAIADAYHEAIEAFHQTSIGASRVATRPIPFAASPTFSEIRDRIVRFAKSELVLAAETFVGSIWWTEGLVPEPTDGGKLLVGGVATLGRAVEEQLCINTTTCGPSYCGLFVHSWTMTIRSGMHLRRFCEQLQPGAIALINLWQDEVTGPLLSIEAVEDLLRLNNMEPIRSVGTQTKPLLVLGLSAQPYIEIAILSRRRMVTQSWQDAA